MSGNREREPHPSSPDDDPPSNAEDRTVGNGFFAAWVMDDLAKASSAATGGETFRAEPTPPARPPSAARASPLASSVAVEDARAVGLAETVRASSSPFAEPTRGRLPSLADDPPQQERTELMPEAMRGTTPQKGAARGRLPSVAEDPPEREQENTALMPEAMRLRHSAPVEPAQPRAHALPASAPAPAQRPVVVAAPGARKKGSPALVVFVLFLLAAAGAAYALHSGKL